MNLARITLRNFGVFLGSHSIDLSPISPAKPVILVGGLNGAGKTTLLEGLLLCVYGPIASLPRPKARSYEDYLLKTINRRAEPSEDASVEVVFRSREEGKLKEYRICRAWGRTDKGIKERFSVQLDGKDDPVLTDAWQEHLEHFIPPGISRLFFFDGEQIESLADPDKSASMLQDAISGLLGMDLVAQLQTDLAVVETRKQRKTQTDDERQQAEQLENEIRELSRRVTDLKQQEGSSRSSLDELQKRKRKLDGDFKKQGGQLFEQRSQIELGAKALEKELDGVHRALLALAAGSLPLAMLANKLPALLEKAKRQNEAQRTQAFVSMMKELDAPLLQLLRKNRVEQGIISRVEDFLEGERKKRSQSATNHDQLGLTERSIFKAQDLETSLAGEVREADEAIATWEKLRKQEEQFERQLAMVPDEADLEKTIAERNRLHAEELGIERDLGNLNHEIRSLEVELTRKVSSFQKKQEHALTDLDSQRFLLHSRRVRDTLEKFKIAATKHHSTRLEKLIIEKYKMLLHKRSLVHQVKISPEQCTLQLYNSDGQHIETNRLSAGERQLLAVSILWALAEASGRHLPVIIDTPLGRLDASHRHHLVSKYFPRAAQQVILLSTDEEITTKYYRELKPFISHEYHLAHDDDAQGTVIKPGYFWQEEESESCQLKLFDSQKPLATS